MSFNKAEAVVACNSKTVIERMEQIELLGMACEILAELIAKEAEIDMRYDSEELAYMIKAIQWEIGCEAACVTNYINDNE